MFRTSSRVELFIFTALFPPCSLLLPLGLFGAVVVSQAPSSPAPLEVSSMPFCLSTWGLAVPGQVQRAGLSFLQCLLGSRHIWWNRAWPVLNCPCCRCLVPLGCQTSEREACPSHPHPGVGVLLQKLEPISPCLSSQRAQVWGLRVEGEHVSWWWFLGKPLPNYIPSHFPDRASIWTSSWSHTGLSAWPLSLPP